MKLLKNKSTGEIGCLVCLFEKTPEKITVVKYINGRRGSKVWYYGTLEQLNEEWEDYEEPKEYWFIDDVGEIEAIEADGSEEEQSSKEIGNYFETEEEAEKAVEKLKAYKRLKDKGFKFEGIKEDYTRILQQQAPFRTGRRYLQFNKSEDEDWMKENWDDLSLIFGEEEK